jgi:hypothetical protein
MSHRPPFCIAGLLFAAAVALLAGAPSAGANEVCGAIPTELDEQAARDAFGAADAAGFIESRAPLEAALDGVCDGNGDGARLFKERASRVVFQIAAGATEPLPYLDGGALIVEFYGGAFDAAQFRREVEDTLRGESSEFND